MFLMLALQLAFADQCACEGGNWVDAYEIEPCDASVEGGCSCECFSDSNGVTVCENEAGPIPEGTTCEWADEQCTGSLDCTDDVVLGDDKGCSTLSGATGSWAPVAALLVLFGRRRSR